MGGPAHPTNFNSLADILRYFDVYRNGHNWKQKYVDTGKPYKKNWFIIPLEPCQVEVNQTDDSKEFWNPELDPMFNGKMFKKDPT